MYISVNASPVRSESGEVVGGVAVFRDITARQMEEEALAQAFAHGRLEVIDTVLHNIGNAINSVATGVDTLHQWLEEGELMRRFARVADLVGAHDRGLDSLARARRTGPAGAALSCSPWSGTGRGARDAARYRRAGAGARAPHRRHHPHPGVLHRQHGERKRIALPETITTP